MGIALAGHFLTSNTSRGPSCSNLGGIKTRWGPGGMECPASFDLPDRLRSAQELPHDFAGTS